jgi:hypothetical protein
MTDFLTSWKRHADLVAKANVLNKAIVFDALAAAGITDILVEFDGGGDSGQIEGVLARAGDKPIDLPTTTLSLHTAGWGEPELAVTELPLAEAIENLCYGYLEQKHEGWENNDGAYGEFTFNVAERRIELDFNGRFTDTWHDAHTF